METTDTKPKKQVCIIKIIFPVSSDEEAIEVKKTIAEHLDKIPEAVINFSLMSGQPPLPLQ